MMHAVAMTHSVDASLVAESLTGNREAFGQIVARYQTLICSLAYNGTGNLSQSEDVAQETFIAAWKQLQNLREPHKLRSWLCGIARNITYDTLKRQGREPSHAAEALSTIQESPAPEPQPHDFTISNEEAAILWRSLERLPEIYREPLVLFYREHQSVQTVAAALELTEDAVKQRLSRGRKLLHEQILAFVEGALERTKPGKAFTLATLASLPALPSSAKAVAIGAAAAEASASGKTIGGMGLFSVLLGPLAVVLPNFLGYRMALAEAQSYAERARIKSFFCKIVAITLALFVPFVGVVLWLSRNQADRSYLSGLLATGLVLIFLPTMLFLFIASARERRASYSRILARQYAGVFPQAAWEYRSGLSLFGLPIVHIRIGDRFALLKKPVTAWIAVGQKAVGGLFAFGAIAVAPLSIGGLSVGVLSFGGLSLGVLALGAIALGVWPLFGGLIIGWQAFGRCFSIAWNAAAGDFALAHDFALGRFAHATQGNSQIAREFIEPNLLYRCSRFIHSHWLWLILLWAIPFCVLWRVARQRLNKKVAVLLLLAGVVGAHADASVFPKGTNLTSLVVIKESDLGSTAQRVMIATLQGIVARHSGNQIYIVGTSAGYPIWCDHLKTVYGIPNTQTSNPWSLMAQNKNLISGYIFYDRVANSSSLNVATSLCGPFDAIAVDAAIEATVRAYGITNRILDVRTRDEAWAWAGYSNVFTRELVIEQKESIGANLRDYAAMSGAFTLFDGNSPFRTSIMNQMPADCAWFGWGDSSLGEDIPVGIGSSNGVYTVGSDWALNLSTLSSVPAPPIHQRTYTAAADTETNVHYVTFITTDGDNLQWNVGDLAGYFTNAARGRFNMGWAISPVLADVAPSVLRWYYDNSSNGPFRDFFVVGTSGIGYLYPSKYPPAALDLHVQKLNDFMDRADMNLVHINDFASFGRLDLWNKYLAQSNIDGLFYLEYSRYSAMGGFVLFSSNGQPIISARDLLWGGVQEPAQAIANINSYPRDPSSWAGYTLVEVHVWTKSLSDVQNVVTNLGPHVRVVTPDTFVKLVRNNVGRRLTYDFSDSLQGWTGQTAGGPFDRASWTGAQGNAMPSLLLDGSDIGRADSTPNSLFWRQIILPANVQALQFDTCAAGDGLLCVQVVAADGSIATLLDWEKLPLTNTWVTRSASLTNYAGQTVFFYFQQNDGGQGSSQIRYVDGISVQTDSPPIYVPNAPKLLTVTATNFATLVWRDNDANESGFKIERSSGTNGVWLEIGSASSNAASHTDMSVNHGATYSYRLRSWNAGGHSPYSNVRMVVTPRRPAITVVPMSNSLQLSWPSWASNFTICSASNVGSAANWVPLVSPVTNLNGGVGLVVPLAPGNEFIQLRSK